MLGTKLLASLVLALTLVAALACAKDVGEPAAPAAPTATAPAAPKTAAPAAVAAPAGGFVVDVSDFLEEFDENAVAATGKYKGQEVTVTGTVSTIDFDFMDNPYVAITGGGMFEMNAVWCMIDDASQSAGLNSDDDVTVVGTFKEWNTLNVTLGKCSVK